MGFMNAKMNYKILNKGMFFFPAVKWLKHIVLDSEKSQMSSFK